MTESPVGRAEMFADSLQPSLHSTSAILAWKLSPHLVVGPCLGGVNLFIEV